MAFWLNLGNSWFWGPQHWQARESRLKPSQQPRKLWFQNLVWTNKLSAFSSVHWNNGNLASLGTTYSMPRLYSFPIWSTRVFVRDSLKVWGLGIARFMEGCWDIGRVHDTLMVKSDFCSLSKWKLSWNHHQLHILTSFITIIYYYSVQELSSFLIGAAAAWPWGSQAVFPDLADQIDAKVDPGELGAEKLMEYDGIMWALGHFKPIMISFPWLPNLWFVNHGEFLETNFSKKSWLSWTFQTTVWCRRYGLESYHCRLVRSSIEAAMIDGAGRCTADICGLQIENSFTTILAYFSRI